MTVRFTLTPFLILVTVALTVAFSDNAPAFLLEIPSRKTAKLSNSDPHPNTDEVLDHSNAAASTDVNLSTSENVTGH